jgi:hypothetical protein
MRYTVQREIMEMIDAFGVENVIRNLELVRDSAEIVKNKIDEIMDLGCELLDDNKMVPVNAILTSPTQVGKTKYIIDSISRRLGSGDIFVISCDNSLVQMSQMMSRLAENGIVANVIGKVTPTVVAKMLSENKSVVIVMLNNSSQIGKLRTLYNKVRMLVSLKRNYFFHDEADILSKTDVGVDLSDSKVAISHREWDAFFNTVSNSMVNTTRFWISATPENCSTIAGITGGKIVVLPNAIGYRGVSDHVNWGGEFDAVSDEIERIRPLDNGEVILYCVDRKNLEQESLCKRISCEFKCVTLNFNGKSAVLYKCGRLVNGMIDGTDSISSILDKTRSLCSGFPMAVVGFLLMNRGVSFVGSGLNPPTATVMFYKGGVGAHMVGLAQRFGRITGTSRPDLDRRVVYCSTGIYSDYVAYLSNQKVAFDNLRSDETMCEIIKRCGGLKLGRDLDRPTLKRVNKKFSEIGVIGDGRGVGIGVVDMDLDKMKRMVSSWSVVSNNTAIAKLFRRMISCDGKLESGVVRDIIGDGPLSAMTLESHSRDWRFVFRKDSRYHYIREEALNYYNTL